MIKSLEFTKVAYEDDDGIAIIHPDMQVNLSVSTEPIALKDSTPLDKAKLELFKRDENALVISLDTEYHEDALDDGTKRREILSYQVSCYYGGKILRIIIPEELKSIYMDNIQDNIKNNQKRNCPL